MNKEFLWNNKEIIIKRLYVALGVLLILYLIINLVNINKPINNINNINNMHSTSSKVSSEYIPAIVTYSE